MDGQLSRWSLRASTQPFRQESRAPWPDRENTADRSVGIPWKIDQEGISGKGCELSLYSDGGLEGNASSSNKVHSRENPS